MRIHIMLAAFALAVLAATFCQGQEPAGKDPAPAAQEKPAPDAATVAKFKELAGKLGDESFEVREQATKELEDMGESIKALLEAEAAATKDPEVGIRCRLVLERLPLKAWKKWCAKRQEQWAKNPEPVKTKLDSIRISVALVAGEPLEDALTNIREFCGVNVVIDPRASVLASNGPNGELDVENKPASEVIELILKDTDLAYDIVDGVVLISTPKNIMEWPESPLKGFEPKEEWEKSVIEKLVGTRMAIEFSEGTAKDILDFVRAMVGFDIVADEAPAAKSILESDAKSTLCLHDCAVEQVLNILLKPQGLSYCLRDKGVFVSTKEIIDGLREKK